MNSTIIECREKSSGSTDKDINGLFNTTLPQGFKIEQGDSIQLKSVFVDSVAKSSQKIVVEEADSEVTISCCLYNFNKDTESKIYNDAGTTTEPMPDGKCYFATKTENTVDTKLKTLDSLVITQRPSSGHQHWAGFTLTISYYDPAHPTGDPVVKQVSFKVPQTDGDTDKVTISGETRGKNSDGSDKNPNFQKLPLDYRSVGANPTQTEGISKVSPNNSDWDNKYSCDSWPPTLNTGAVDGDGISSLYTTDLSFKLDVATYSPDELARAITDRIARIQQTQSNTITGAYPLDNPFLQTQKQIRDVQGATGDPPLLANRKIYMVSEDGQDMYNYDLTVAGDFYIGASEMALLYDDGNEKFKWGSLHMPYYYTEQIATNFFDAGTPNKLVLVNKEGGVCLTHLEPASLWFDKMGFDASCMVSPTSLVKTFGGGTKVNWRAPVVAREDGITTTGAYLGTDTCINTANQGAGADAKAKPTIVPTLGGGNPVGYNSSSTTPIYATDSMSIGHLNEPYFLVEVGINAPQKFLGQGITMNDIKGIVGKFYSTGNFTNGGVETALQPYIHVGEPFILSDLKIRILDPNKQIADGIGSNNTVFIEIIKANPSVKPQQNKNRI